MSKLSDDRQIFQVSATWGDDPVNRSWYEATQHDLLAGRHLYVVGPGVVFEALAVGTGLTEAEVAIVFAIWLVRRLRGRPIEADANLATHLAYCLQVPCFSGCLDRNEAASMNGISHGRRTLVGP